MKGYEDQIDHTKIEERYYNNSENAIENKKFNLNIISAPYSSLYDSFAAHTLKFLTGTLSYCFVTIYMTH